MKKVKTIAIAFTAGILGALAVGFFQKRENNYYIENNGNAALNKQTTLSNTSAAALNEDFVLASKESTPCVVYIKTLAAGYSSWLDQFFYGGGGQRVSSGSGVIYKSDGYVVTNNHVIEGAENIEVIVGKKSYAAEIVGTDPSSDLAVLKVEADNLPAIKVGNSHNLNVGEWVLAVGNPFNLTSTVTAGIVSAKGRDINIVNDRFPIESFIQTDAAINPGNSGGALVNLKGELVGINTAIYSKTGSYTGYGFAVPVDVVVKITDDIIKYGEVQKAFFGADVVDIDTKTAEEFVNERPHGVVVSQVLEDGAADKAGIEKGDIILTINGYRINSSALFNEELSYRSPGDKIKVKYRRDGNDREVTVTLMNREGTMEILKRDITSSKSLGADLEVVSKVERKKLGIQHGVKVVRVYNGLIRRLGIKEGFIITDVNNQPITTADELIDILERIRGRVTIQGITENGAKGYYSFWF